MKEEVELEVWKYCAPNIQVSNLGQVRSVEHTIIGMLGIRKVRKGFTLFQTVDKTGNHKVAIKGATKTVKSLVAKAFVPNPNNFKRIRHIDKDKDNLVYTNLEWFDRDISMEDEYFIRELWKDGVPRKELVEVTGHSSTTIHMIIHDKYR